VRKHEGADKDRWQKLEQVFVHNAGSRHETWAKPLLADKSATGQLENITTPLMTRTEYLKLRGGIDGDYDIVQLYEEYEQIPPAHVVKRLPRGRQARTNQSERPLLETASQVQSRRQEESSTKANLETLITQLRQQQLEGKRKAQEAQQTSEQERAILSFRKAFPGIFGQSQTASVEASQEQKLRQLALLSDLVSSK
jgi:urease gamma subunit